MASTYRITEPDPDTGFDRIVYKAIMLARAVCSCVTLEYCGVELVVAPASDPNEIWRRYRRRQQAA